MRMVTIDVDKLEQVLRNNISHDMLVADGQRSMAKRIIEAAHTIDIGSSLHDDSHSMDELYHHRAVLFSVIVKMFRDYAWKSKKHSDGTMFDGMFIVGIDTPDGAATYHYDTDKYWDMFDCKVLDKAPEWDGHTPEQAIERIGKLNPNAKNLAPVWHDAHSDPPQEHGEYLVAKIRKVPIGGKYANYDVANYFGQEDRGKEWHKWSYNIDFDYWASIPNLPVE